MKVILEGGENGWIRHMPLYSFTLDCVKCVLISYHISIINANSITGEAADWYEAFKPVKQWKKQTKKTLLLSVACTNP